MWFVTMPASLVPERYAELTSITVRESHRVVSMDVLDLTDYFDWRGFNAMLFPRALRRRCAVPLLDFVEERSLASPVSSSFEEIRYREG